LDSKHFYAHTPRSQGRFGVMGSLKLLGLPHLARGFGISLILLLTAPVSIAAQTFRGVVVDQTGLPLPGVTVQLLNGTVVVTTVTTGGDGTFEIDIALPGSTLVAALDGFETVRIERQAATRIVLEIAHAA